MSYFIFDQARSVNVFANTKPIGQFGNYVGNVGNSFRETSTLPPATMAIIFERDINQAIHNSWLPHLRFRISVERIEPAPMYRVTILDVSEPIVLRMAEVSTPEIDCHDSSIGRIELSELAHFIRHKLAQTLWKYNSDMLSPQGIYGSTNFTYQIVFSAALIERQINSFDMARTKACQKLLSATKFAASA